MASLKSLAKDTAIYGLSSIIGRFLNYLLVPLYTAKLAAASGGYGVITEIYSYTALLLVFLTFGMETSLFRFINKEGADTKKVYATTLVAVTTVCLAFCVGVLGFLDPIAQTMGYGAHPEIIAMMAVVVALDAFQSIPFAYLRFLHCPIKFAALKLLFIVLNIALNILFFLVLDVGDVVYAFIANLACTGFVTLFFFKELTCVRWKPDFKLLRQMLSYAWPILVLGVAGIMNQTIDRIIFPHLVPGAEGRVQLGIYGACVKVAVLMTMITQAFRYAYEPFVFAGNRNKDSKEAYAKAMKFYIIFTLLAFLGVMAYIDILKYIIAPDYWVGLRVVPVEMAAEIMCGVYFNLSFWYKLTDRTLWGAWFSGIACAVLIGISVVFIPTHGYMACAWAGFAAYATAMVLSYFVGQKYYPIDYPLKSIAVYVLIAALFFGVMQLSGKYIDNIILRLGINTICLLLFAAHIIHYDLPIKQILKIRNKR